jgi:DNA-binding CsgD family transcriptional regulator
LLLRLEKIKKRKTELEKNTLSDKLDHTNKELTTHVMYLLRKNEFIITIAEKLKLTKLDAKTENKKIIAELIKELESNSAMISWDDFEIRFQEVYTGFYKKLNINYPDLTPNELRLCAFLRLNMTTKEIAAITYQSGNSIVVARHRLRKKLGIEKDENLVSFLSKV